MCVGSGFFFLGEYTTSMSQEIRLTEPAKGFEETKKTDENGVEYWSARELMVVLGYSKWQNFEEVIRRAKEACNNSRQFTQDHFTDISKMTKIGHGFLFSTAKEAGVSHFGMFNDAGYRGLYGMSLGEIEERKGINKGELLDRAGGVELGANLFRITQTEDKLRRDRIKGDLPARNAHFMIGGKVRQTMKDIGGELPENLKPEQHIKEIKKNMKLIGKQVKKFL